LRLSTTNTTSVHNYGITQTLMGLDYEAIMPSPLYLDVVTCDRQLWLFIYWIREQRERSAPI